MIWITYTCDKLFFFFDSMNDSFHYLFLTNSSFIFIGNNNFTTSILIITNRWTLISDKFFQSNTLEMASMKVVFPIRGFIEFYLRFYSPENSQKQIYWQLCIFVLHWNDLNHETSIFFPIVSRSHMLKRYKFDLHT